MNQQEALTYWLGRVNYEQTIPQPGDLKLERMEQLLAKLGNPHRQLRIVHVAGSKGKGSTAAMIASILRQAGYCTGLFTSPHLCRVEERFEVDEEPISARELTSLLCEIAVAEREMCLERGSSVPCATFFEVATAIGFMHFVRRKVEAAVIEVGLGGRFDSTNVCRPEVAIITSISFDHTGQLGNRLAQIAMEKAGIFKPGCPALSGARGEEARAVVETICRERGAALRRLDAEIHFRHEPGTVSARAIRLPRVQVLTDRRSWPSMELALLGEHQAANAALAIAAIEHLHDAGFRVDDDAVAAGLRGVRWPARLEVLGRRPFVLLDCAHNDASARALVETLEASFPQPHPRRLLIFAGSGDKDLANIFQTLAPHFQHFFLTRFSANPRSVAPDKLALLLQGVAAVPFSLHESAADAWASARTAARVEDLICVTGSVFLAGEMRPIILREHALDAGKPDTV